MLEDVFGDVDTRTLAVTASRAVMNAAEDAGVRDVVERRGEIPEGAHGARHEIGVHGEIGPAAEERREDTSRGAAHRGVARWILRKGRCHEEGRPARVRGGRGISIGVGQRDRRHGPPGDVVVFRFPADDGGVRHGEIQESEQAGVLREGEMILAGELQGRPVPE